MPKKGRDELKGRFKKGMLPGEEDFADLIDSSLNPLEDGFEVNGDDGIKLTAFAEKPLVTVYTGRKDNIGPRWRLTAPETGDALQLSNVEKKRAALLSFGARNQYVGINKESPEHELDVEGVIASTGRVGAFKDNAVFEDEVLADGKWKTIISKLNGCNMFEIAAGVRGEAQSGRIALLRAVAMNAFNPSSIFPFLGDFKRKIKHQHAYYLSRWDRIQLRWATNPKDKTEYSLQIRTVRDYTVRKKGRPPKAYKIRFRITRMWFEPALKDCEAEQNPESDNKQ